MRFSPTTNPVKAAKHFVKDVMLFVGVEAPIATLTQEEIAKWSMKLQEKVFMYI